MSQQKRRLALLQHCRRHKPQQHYNSQLSSVSQVLQRGKHHPRISALYLQLLLHHPETIQSQLYNYYSVFSCNKKQLLLVLKRAPPKHFPCCHIYCPPLPSVQFIPCLSIDRTASHNWRGYKKYNKTSGRTSYLADRTEPFILFLWMIV